MPRLMSVLLLSVLAAAPSLAATPVASDPTEAAFRDLYRELVETNTTRSVGSCTRAAEAMRARLAAAGLASADMQILAPADRPGDGALVAVLRGRESSLQPILLLAHIDVVEARREDWKRDPFKLVEEGGWFYARGASDDKAMAAVFTDSLVRMRREGFKPRRDIKLALTCGEETPDVFNSVKWLIATQPDVLRAEFALNEGASGELDAQGRHVALQVQAGEKVYQDFALEVTDPGGHSARPTRNNAIVRLANALSRLGSHQFAISLNPVTRAYFEAQAAGAPATIAADMRAVLAHADEGAAGRLWDVNPAWNSSLRTTCVVTQITGGHAPNALPQKARANVNCRILPGVPVADVEREIVAVAADPAVSVSRAGEPALQSPVPPLSDRIMGPVREVAAKLWPGVAVVPTMSTGATDGRFLNASGVTTYGLSGMFHDAEGAHAHGLDERIRVQSLLEGRRFLYEVVRRYADAP
jgi:acetylornithine deacetylase/succinyl-diaminopimelate desuccinylase-like protein